jgi:ferredoxin
MMNVSVDFEACEMHGDCVMEAPEVFDLHDDSDVVVLLDDAPPESLRAKVQAAVKSCPVAAIRLQW